MKYHEKVALKEHEVQSVRQGHGKGLRFPVFETRQGDKRFYVGVIDSRDLHPVSYADVQTQENLDGTQRPKTDPHVNEIRKDILTGAVIPHDLVCALTNGARVEHTGHGLEIVTPAVHGNFFQFIDGQHRNYAAHEAIENDGFDKPFQYVVAFIDSDDNTTIKRLRIHMSTTTHHEDTAATRFKSYQVKDLSPNETSAVALLLRAEKDIDSKLFQRIKYIQGQGKAKGGKIRLNEAADKMKSWYTEVPAFAALSHDEQYLVFDSVFRAWATFNDIAWNDQSAYMLSRPFGIMSLLLTTPYVLKKAIQKHHVLTAQAVEQVIEGVSHRLTVNNNNIFLGCNYGTDYQSRDSFRSKVVNKLGLVSDDVDPLTGRRELVKLADPREHRAA